MAAEMFSHENASGFTIPTHLGQGGYCIIAVSFLAYSYLRHGRHLLVVHCPPRSRLPVRPSAPPPRTHVV